MLNEAFFDAEVYSLYMLGYQQHKSHEIKRVIGENTAAIRSIVDLLVTKCATPGKAIDIELPGDLQPTARRLEALGFVSSPLHAVGN